MRSKYPTILATTLIVLLTSSFLWAEDPGHPRLLLTEEKAQDIWNRIISTDPSLEPADEMWGKLRTEANYTIETFCGSNPDTFSTFYQYREIDKLALVGLLLRQSANSDSIQLGEAFTDSSISLCEREIVAYTTPDNTWDKFKAIHRVKALSLTYDWGYSRFTETQKTDFEDAILRNLFEGVVSIYEHFTGNNWSSASNMVGKFDKHLTKDGDDEFPQPPED